jgi:hypothetical protein
MRQQSMRKFHATRINSHPTAWSLSNYGLLTTLRRAPAPFRDARHRDKDAPGGWNVPNARTARSGIALATAFAGIFIFGEISP